MVFRYHPDTDMLYIQLAGGTSTDSEEVAPGVVLDFNANDQVVGIEIENARSFIDMSHLDVSALPIVDLVFSKKVLVER